MTSPPKHVAFLLNDLALGGAERVVITLCNALATRGFRAELLLRKRQGPLLSELSNKVTVTLLPAAGRWRWMPALLQLAAAGSSDVLSLVQSKPPGFVRRLPALRDYLRREKPDVLLSTLTGNNLLAVWAGQLANTQTRLVLREAINLLSDYNEDRKASPAKLPSLLKQWYPRADSVVCVSQGVERDLQALLGHRLDNTQTIYNPLDVATITELSRPDPRHPWLEDSDYDCIVALGRLEPQKDYATLLRAFARLSATQPARLIILGEGSEREMLTALARELGIAERLDLHGAVANPFQFLVRADLYVMSSAWEGCPNALMEAMACGCRVVSTDCPSGPRELLQDGAIGTLAPVGDADALAGAMAEALAKPPAQEEVKARAAEYDLPSVVERYLEVLLPEQANAT